MARHFNHARLGLIGLLVIVMQAVAGDTADTGGSTLAIEWQTIDGGGGISTAGTLRLVSTIGQPDPGTATAGDLQLNGGFLPGTYEIALPCPADTNGDELVDINDLLDVLAAWGPCPAPCPTDTNGDDVVDINDLLDLLAAWGMCPGTS